MTEKVISNEISMVIDGIHPHKGMVKVIELHTVQDKDETEYILIIHNSLENETRSSFAFLSGSYPNISIDKGQLFINPNDDTELRNELLETYFLFRDFKSFSQEVLDFFQKEHSFKILQPKITYKALSSDEFQARFRKVR